MITLKAVGDIMLSQKVGEYVELKGPDYIFDNVRNVLSDADITIGNLECPLSDKGDPTNNKFVFRASPNCAQALKASGFNVLSLANNHILDYGPPALIDTIDNLRKNDIYYVGAGNNIDEACKPLIIEKAGIKIAFLAFTNTNIAKKGSPGCPPCNLNFMQKKIKNVKHDNDLVIVSIHHGIEYVDYPSRYFVSLFRGVVDAGAALVIGHHPHVIQGLELYNGSLIAYSLGNFISSSVDEETRTVLYKNTALSYFTDYPLHINDMRSTESMILHCQLNRKGVDNYKLIPIKSNSEFQPVLMNINESETFLRKVLKISGKFSCLDHPVFDEMDALWEQCQMHCMKNMKFGSIIKRIYYIRFKHFMLIAPYIKSKLRRI